MSHQNLVSELKRPKVTAKYAQTLDGRIATSIGHSRWVTSPESLKRAHQMRAAHDAVLVGIGTVLADDPRLIVRLSEGRNPLRIVVDSRLRTPLNAAVLSEDPATTVIATAQVGRSARRAEIEERGARVTAFPDGNGRVDLVSLLEELSRWGIGSVLVEGGSGIITSMLRAGLVDEVAIFMAPKIIGSGLEAVGELGIQTMDQALTFTDHSIESLGPDILFRGRLG